MNQRLGNLTPADVHFGRDQTILIERERIKRQTIANRRLLHRRQVSHNVTNQTSQRAASCPENSDDGQWLKPQSEQHKRIISFAPPNKKLGS